MILFSDNFNFSEKNFHALYVFLSKYNVEFEYDNGHETLKKNLYEINEIESCSGLTQNLDKYEVYKGFLLFDIYEVELLQKSMSTDKWVEEMPSNPSSEEIWSFFIEFFREELYMSIQCSKFWIDYWRARLSLSEVQVGLFFSGGQIYNRAFCEVMKKRNTPTFAMEHYFTGNDFYLEPKYEPLPNNSTIKNPRFFVNLTNNAQNDSEFESDKKLKNAKNKNVQQPSYSSIEMSDYILILMQVRNDYAIASKHNNYKNSVKFVHELASNILEKTNKKIVIKSHPYEINKIAPEQKTSLEFINDYIHDLSDEHRERIHVYSDFSLESLIDSSSHVITLNSQTGIEASSRCKPVICFGSAFYGSKGFTYDYEDINSYIRDINNIHFSIDNLLAYKNFKKNIFFHLIGTGEVNKVENIFESVGLKFSIKENMENENIKNTEKNEILKEFIPTKKDTQRVELKQDKTVKVSTNKNKDTLKTVRLARKLYKDPKRFFLDTRIMKTIKERL